jgi:triosephosphate isomerase
MTRKLILGNWKMHGSLQGGRALAATLAESLTRAPTDNEIAVFPPAHLLLPVRDALGTAAIKVGGQDCHADPEGSYTGDISATMLHDVGCEYVIAGHSERRGHYGETSAEVRTKALAAQETGIEPVICVGHVETQETTADQAEAVAAQVTASLPSDGSGRTLTIAYEPVWALGARESATMAHIATVHGRIRRALDAHFGADTHETVRIVYGGSVNKDNAAEIMAQDDVDGVLVGRAALDADSFLQIAAVSA